MLHILTIALNTHPGLSFDKQVWVLSVMDKMVDLLALLSTMGGKESGRGIGAVVKLVKAVFAEASSMDSVQGGNSMLYKYRGLLYSAQTYLIRTQAEPGRAGKQQQEQTSPNHVRPF